MNIKEKINDLSVLSIFIITFLPPLLWSIFFVVIFNPNFDDSKTTLTEAFEITLIAPLLETLILIGFLKVLDFLRIKNLMYKGLACGILFSIIHFIAHWISSLNAFYSFSIMAIIYSSDKSFRRAFLVFFIHFLNNSISVIPDIISEIFLYVAHIG